MLLFRVDMKTIILIDGFNFYHKIENFRLQYGVNYKWLDYRSLGQSLLKDDHRLQPFSLSLNKVYFYTAIAHHRKKGAVIRHRTYLKALRFHGIEVVEGNFKEKERRCPSCKYEYVQHEEKETDVNIALKLFEGAVNHEYDACLLFSGDNDLLPAIKLVKTHYPTKKVILVTPPGAAGFASMSSICDVHIGIRINRLQHHQFPDHIDLGHEIVSNPYLVFKSP